jgi:glycosidase
MHTPWYENACFYHINPLSLCNAPARQDGRLTYRLEKIEQWLDHIVAMGFTAIYLGPVFDSLSHGYDTTDYRTVDPRLGDNQTLVNLVHACHGRGLKVILDGVFNHTGRAFFAFRDIERRKESSPYKSWYRQVRFEKDSFFYENWRGCEDLAVLDLQNHEVADYLLSVVRYWQETFHIDGLRLDCADRLDFGFLERLHETAKQQADDFYLLGEVIHGDYRDWTTEDRLDSVTNYELHKALYSSHNDRNLFELAFCANREFGPEGLYRDRVLYNFVDNHDVDRIASKVRDRRHLFNIHTLLYLLPGIVGIYYGSEWGIEGRKSGSDDSPLRPAIEVGEIGNGNRDLMRHIEGLVALRKDHAALRHGTYGQIAIDSTLYAFERRCEEESILVISNAGEQAEHLSIDADPGYRYLLGLDCSFTQVGRQLETTVGPFQTLVLALTRQGGRDIPREG